MTAQDILRAAHEWHRVHYQIHGDFTPDEACIVNEVIEFLVNCAQAIEATHATR